MDHFDMPSQPQSGDLEDIEFTVEPRGALFAVLANGRLISLHGSMFTASRVRDALIAQQEDLP